MTMYVRQDEDLLAAMAEEVMQCNIEKGWFDESRTFGDDIALLHSEVSEMLEAYRDHGMTALRRFARESGGYALLPADDQNVERWESSGTLGKPEGVASEAADVLVRLLDTCKRYDIDLFAEWRRKMDFNWTRPTRHGGKKL